MLLFPTVSWVVTFPYIDEPQSIKWFGSAIGLILCQMCVLAGCEWELKSPTIVLSKFFSVADGFLHLCRNRLQSSNSRRRSKESRVVVSL